MSGEYAYSRLLGQAIKGAAFVRDEGQQLIGVRILCQTVTISAMVGADELLFDLT